MTNLPERAAVFLTLADSESNQRAVNAAPARQQIAAFYLGERRNEEEWINSQNRAIGVDSQDLIVNDAGNALGLLRALFRGDIYLSVPFFA